MNVSTASDQFIRAWHDFVDDQVIPLHIRPIILNSWKRCKMRLNPFLHTRLRELNSDLFLATQIASFNLISFARPIMEDIYQNIEGSNSVVVLANSAGYILEMIGDNEMIESLKEFGILPGGCLSEAHAGTNAFALALTERIPAQVIGGEHFLGQFHKLADAAAPIFDLTGRPLGIIGCIYPVASAHSHSLGLTAAGALAVMGQIQSDFLQVEQINQLAELNAILAAISEGILVWNADWVLIHINAAAAKIIGVPPETLVGRKVAEFLTYPAYIQSAVEKQEPVTDVEAKFRFGEREVNCVLSMRFVHNSKKELQWVIVTFRQEKEIYRLVQNQMGAQAFFMLDDIVGSSPEIQRVRRTVKSVAAAKASVLIRGEIGTLKNIVASAIHNESQRRDGPFLIFSCSDMPNELILRELLGMEEGISQKRAGGRPSKFELAQGGTLFFQEVDALSLEAQAILLNVIELGIVQRLGSSHPIAVDIRIIASTAANMEKLIAQGNFRADLYYRLSAFEIRLPPLRERQKDIPILAEQILSRISHQLNRPLSLASGVMELLVKYPWPGNIGELEAVLGQAAILAGVSEVIGPMHLQEFVLRPAKLPIDAQRLTGLNSLDDIQQDAFLQAARMCNGNVTKMAQTLGVGRTTVWRRLRKYEISVDDFRARGKELAER